MVSNFIISPGNILLLFVIAKSTLIKYKTLLLSSLLRILIVASNSEKKYLMLV